MAILTKNDFRQMSEAQLGEKMADLRKELMKMNTQISTGTTPESPGKVREVKKVIARIITVLSLRKKTSKEKKVEKKPEEEKKKQ